jgi:hypothetical protein
MSGPSRDREACEECAAAQVAVWRTLSCGRRPQARPETGEAPRLDDAAARECARELDGLLEELAGLPEPSASIAQRTIARLLRLHGEGLARLIDRLQQAGHQEILSRLHDDEVIAQLLVLHDPRPDEAPAERCDLCAAPIGPDHRHLLDRKHQRLLCACRPCSLHFDHDAAEGRYRMIPDRRCLLAEPLSASGAPQVPAGLLFVVRRPEGPPSVFYPGPAGISTGELDVEAWTRWSEQAPLLATLEPEVEAFLHRSGAEAEDWLLPLDDCYRLAGVLRRHWRGFTGGDAVRGKLDEFFSELRARARVVDRGGHALAEERPDVCGR